MGLEEKIVEYLKRRPCEIFSVENLGKIEIVDMTAGAYNLNYHILVGDKNYIFRVNIQQQSGLSNQIEYEFKVLKYLEKYQIAPKVFYFDSSRLYFDFDILIEEYLEGQWATLDEVDMPDIAKLLSKLHNIRPLKEDMIIWNKPLVDNLKFLEKDLQEYSSKKSSEENIIKIIKDILEKIEILIIKYEKLFLPESIIHTDIAIDNIIKTPQGLKLIDWEKPRIDDCSYDVCCFLAEPAQLWCVPTTISERAKEVFLSTYLEETRKDREIFLEKIKIRQPLVSLHWVLWGMNRFRDIKDNETTLELQQVHNNRLERWERVTDINLLIKIYEMIDKLAN